jgi:hypothetical protein
MGNNVNRYENMLNSGQVLQLAGVSGNERASWLLSGMVYKRSGIARQLLQRGEILRVKRGKVHRNLFTQEAAKAMAGEVTRRLEAFSPRVARSVPEAAKEVVVEAAVEPVVVPPVAVAQSEPLRPFGAASEALEWLARAYDVPLAWGDNFTLDYEETIVRVAERIREYNAKQ